MNLLSTTDKEEQVNLWLFARQKARTNLFWFLKEVLQYKDIEEEVHGPIIDLLQKFDGGTDTLNKNTGKIIDYTPKVGIWELKGPRKRLFLDPRGHLKTTVITIGHSVQWIINYPDIRILQSMATGDQVTKVIQETLSHFRYNDRFRYLFPDFCPPAKNAKDFGNNESFTVPNRKRKWLKEATVSTCSVGKVVAGGHYEVLKNTDLVDKENVKTPNQVREVKDHFYYLNPLLERGAIAPYHGWTDVEGTRYDFSDLYGEIIDKEEALPEEKRSWLIHVRSAELEDGTLWPTRFPQAELDSILQDVGDYIFSCQYLQKPIPQGSGLASKDEIRFVYKKILKSLPMRIHMTVDLAGMEQNLTGDFTVLTTAGFDNDGRMNVLDIRCGRYTPFEVIQLLFDLHKLYPKMLDIKIEKDAHMRVLAPFIKREQQKRQQKGGRWLPPIIELKRDTRTSKKQRIKGLQPWFKAGIIRFAEDISPRLELMQQILRYSDTSTYHDDILDTLADQMQNRDGGPIADVYPDAPKGEERMDEKFLGFDKITHEMTWAGQKESEQYYDPMTGL